MDMSKCVTTGVTEFVENNTQENVITLSVNLKLKSGSGEHIKVHFDNFIETLCDEDIIERVQTEYNDKEKTTRISMATDNKGANICG